MAFVLIIGERSFPKVSQYEAMPGRRREYYADSLLNCPDDGTSLLDQPGIYGRAPDGRTRFCRRAAFVLPDQLII